MIAKYKNEYFKIALMENPIRLWKYEYVEGFNKRINDWLTIYEKCVDLDEIEEVFEIGFSVCWDGQWCGIDYISSKELLSLVTNRKNFAMSHDMYEFERGVYECTLPATQFKEYRMWKKELHKESTYTMLSYEEFKVLWKLMVSDLIPDRP